MLFFRAIMACALILGCASTRQGSASRTHPGDVHLVVTNEGWADQVVYLYHLGQRFRIGIISGMSTAALRIPASLVPPDNTVQFLVHPIAGSEDQLTETVALGEDVHPVLTINPALKSTFLAVMPNPRR
jgi:hypothetical protein